MKVSALSVGDESLLLVCDIQTRLADAMAQSERAMMIKNGEVLLEAARKLGVPVVVTEQYPKGLGPTEPAIFERLPSHAPRFEKTCFSCYAVDGVRQELTGQGRTQVHIIGQETHVCVLQTALDFVDQGFQVFVVEDAVCSRSAVHKQNALQRMRASGVVVTNTESVVFEWLGDAAHPQFKSLSSLVR